MASSELLDVFQKVQFDESITKYEYHSYLPYLNNTFKHYDEVCNCTHTVKKNVA